jgi:hypothetical protein
MAIRDALNHLGQKVGEVQMPDETTEAQWLIALAPYLVPPQTEQQKLALKLARTVDQGRKAADAIIDAFKKDNLASFVEQGLADEVIIMKSCWLHHRFRAVDYTIGGIPMVCDLMNLCITGDLETAYTVLSLMEPDDMTQPYHFFSQAKIDQMKALVGSYI